MTLIRILLTWDQESDCVSAHLGIQYVRDEILAVPRDEYDAVGPDHAAVDRRRRRRLCDVFLAESLRAPLRFRMFSAQFRVSRLFFLGGQPFDLLEPAGFELILALLLGDADGGREVAVLVRCLEAASEVSPFRVARGGGGGTGTAGGGASALTAGACLALATAETVMTRARPRVVARVRRAGLMPGRVDESDSDMESAAMANARASRRREM